MTTKNNIKVAGAGIAGAVIGAVVGAAGVILSDEKNRKQIGKKLTEYKKHGQKIYSNLKDKVEDLSVEGEEKVIEKVKEVKKAVKSKL